MRNKTQIILTLLILLSLISPNTFAQDDEPYLVIGDGHTDLVVSVSFSPDGHILASATFSGTIKLWDARTGVVLRTLTGFGSIVSFSPDGNTLASAGNTLASASSDVQLWDVKTGELLKTLTGHTGWIFSVAFSPDGNILASASRDETIRLWDVKTGELLKTLTGHTDDVNVSFSPDGNTLATSLDGTIKLWDANTRELRSTIRLWNANTGEIPITIEDEGVTLSLRGSEFFSRIAFSPDGNTIAGYSNSFELEDNTLLWDGTIKLWDVNTGEHIKTLEVVTGFLTNVVGIPSIAFSPDGNTIASGSGLDNTIHLWDINTGEHIKTLEGQHMHWGFYSVSFHPDGNTLASANLDVQLWDARTGELLRTIPPTTHTDDVTSVSFHPDGNTLASASLDNTIRLWNANTGENIKTLTGHTDDVTSVSFHPDGNTLASASLDNTIRLWNANTGENIKTLTGHTGGVTSVSFHPDGNTLASASLDTTIRLWNANTGENIKTLTGHTYGVTSVAFHPDGNTLASASLDTTIRLWNANTSEHIRTLEGHRSSINSVSFSPDGTTLASGSGSWGYDTTIRLWNANTSEHIRTLEGHRSSINSVSFSPDGTTLASAGGDIVRLWNTNTGELLKTLHTSWGSIVSFSPDGTTLASAGEDNIIRLWYVEPATPTLKKPKTTVSLSKLSSIVAPGKAFTLDATLENIGGISAAATLQFYGPVKVELTTTQATSGTLPAIDFTDKTLGAAIDIPAMAADGTHKETITTTAPATAGTYAYKACIQRPDNTGGTDEICSDVFTVTIAPPDLQFVKVWAEPATVAPSAAFKLYATVSNPGGQSDRTTLWWYSLGAKDNTEKPEELQGTRIDSLPMADGKVTVTKHITVTAPETPGHYIYRASVDEVDGEKKSSNNYNEVTITVGIPDVVVESITVSRLDDNTKTDDIAVNDGEQFYLHVTFKNTGAASSATTKVRYYRSANDTISETDKLIAEGKNVSLSSGKAFNRQLTVTAPTIGGTYYYGVYVDSVANESNTDNNWSDVVKVTVTKPGRFKLEMRPDFISDVAYGADCTYFVLNAGFLKVTELQELSQDERVDDKVCFIELDIPGVEDDQAGLGDVLSALSGGTVDERLTNPGYYMFPVETPLVKLRGVIPDDQLDIEDIANVKDFAEAIKAIPDAAENVVDKLGKVFSALNVFTAGAQSAVNTLNALEGTADPKISLVYPASQRILFRISKQIDYVDLSVLQRFHYSIWSESEGKWIQMSFSKNASLFDKVKWTVWGVSTEALNFLGVSDDDLQAGLKPDPEHDQYAVWENRWNLRETWQQENPGLAAPHAQPMSLVDYPPFQQLSPEAQAYLLQLSEHPNFGKTITLETQQIPEETSLLANYPNPFNPETWIPYQLAASADVTLTIYDIHGRVVRNIGLGHQRAGMYHSRSRAASWDGRNAVGELVASGVYFYTLTAGDFTATRKMLIRK